MEIFGKSRLSSTTQALIACRSKKNQLSDMRQCSHAHEKAYLSIQIKYSVKQSRTRYRDFISQVDVFSKSL